MKVDIPYTYGYKDFISDNERNELEEWAYSIFNKKELKHNGHGRFFNSLSKLSGVIEQVNIIKNKIIEQENLQDALIDPYFEDFLSFNLEGAAIHPHSDPNLNGCVHTRYNLIVSMPDQGGLPVYNNKVVEIKEKMLWRCEAGKYVHQSTPVVGSRPRINLSFGFQVKQVSV